MNDQQNINNNSNDNVILQNYGDILTRKIEATKKAKKFVKIAAIFSSIWVSCFILFIILIIAASVQVSLNTISNNDFTPITQNLSIWTGIGIVALIFLFIGVACTLTSFIIGIIAIVMIFSISDENNFIINNEITYINKSLTSPKILSIIGVVICGSGFGTIFFWIANSQLGNVLNAYSHAYINNK